MKTLITFGAGAVAPWVAAVVLQRLTRKRRQGGWIEAEVFAAPISFRDQPLSRPPQPTR